MRSQKVRVGDKVLQGYRREDFENVFARLLHGFIRNTGTDPINIDDSEPPDTERVPEPEHESPPSLLNSSSVPDETGWYSRVVREDGVVEHILDFTDPPDDPNAAETVRAAHTSNPGQ